MAACKPVGFFNGYGDIDLGGRDQVDDDAVLFKNIEYLGHEPVGHEHAVGVDVDDRDAPLGCYCRGGLGRRQAVGVRVDNGAGQLGLEGVFDVDRYAHPHDLLHGERVNDLGAVIGELCRLFGRDGRQHHGIRHLARVGGENAIDFFPYLQLPRADGGRGKGCGQVGIAPADAVDDAAGHKAEIAREHGHLVAAGLDAAAQLRLRVGVEFLARLLEFFFDDQGEVDKFGIDAHAVEKARKDTGRELLAHADDDILRPRATFRR